MTANLENARYDYAPIPDAAKRQTSRVGGDNRHGVCISRVVGRVHALAVRAVGLALALAMSSAGSVEIRYSQAEHEECQSGGGCQIVTREALLQIAERGYAAGRATCETRL